MEVIVSLQVLRTRVALMAGCGLLVAATVTFAENPSTKPSADDVLSRMLRPSNGTSPQPLQPATAPGTMIDATSGPNALAPDAAPTRVMREGDIIANRTGRLQRSADGQQWEFAFDSDGKALKDPPLVILPNLKLMDMEEAAKSARRDLRFRVTGEITEYRGRNYVLLQKVLVVPDVTQQF
jgi:hypothetical protein